MPCESCNVQFTVFKRKKSCSECRRLYCNQCLVKRKDKILCDRCVIFTTRPLTKVELLKLKPKDLIFYLQSKHVSTTGCVEKEELVNLVLIHVNNSYPVDASSNGTNSDDPYTNPFDQIKQTCHNLFSSFTDKIASDLNLDFKQSTSNQAHNISSQPRASTRSTSTNSNISSSYGNNDNNEQLIGWRNNAPKTDHTSPVHSINSNSSIVTSSSVSNDRNATAGPSTPHTAQSSDHSRPPKSLIVPSVHANGGGTGRTKSSDRLDNDVDDEEPNHIAGSTCDCSSDDVINTFHVNYNKRSTPVSPTSTTTAEAAADNRKIDLEAGPSGSSSKTGSSANNKIKNSPDSSNASSFEDIGAIRTASDSGGDNLNRKENWEIVNRSSIVDADCKSEVDLSNTTFPTPHSSDHQVGSIGRSPFQFKPPAGQCPRRRSDSSIGWIGYTAAGAEIQPSLVSWNFDSPSCKRTKTSCQKCGKGRGNLKRHVTKFRQQLEDSNATESEIKVKLEAFLLYLESVNRSSAEVSDSDSGDERQLATVGSTVPSSDVNIEIDQMDTGGEMPNQQRDDDDRSFIFGDDDGIHVYATDTATAEYHAPKQFISLNDYDDSSDLDELSVKQLKQLLMLNRVDFKGCCEKTELLERVKRLWKDSHKTPAVEKLPTDELCKICMDAPIECVILECGHMATCTGCGKVLSECPICRQYIVRVVRFFKA